MPTSSLENVALIECVPNFSEGRRKNVVEEITKAADSSQRRGARVLDCHWDYDHNRMVLTIVGTPAAVTNSVISASAKAIELIDMRKHEGVHPRVGAVDVIPFVPLGTVTMEDCIALSRSFAKRFAERFSVPVYLYAEAAMTSARRKLASVRAGQFEGLRDLIGSDRAREPDFGPGKINPTAGATCVGARRILIAYNIDLDSDDIGLANKIARRIRERDGGLIGVQALGFALERRGIVQVSTNVLDYRKTSLKEVFDVVSQMASDSGTKVLDSEIVGMVPHAALPDFAVADLQLVDFSLDKILENRISELLTEDSL